MPLLVSVAATYRFRCGNLSVPLAAGGPNTGSGRYSLGADTKRVDKVRIWYQAGVSHGLTP